MRLHGIHHLTAVTANVAGNHKFYTETLGLRMVKKTVNQDDVSAYHLFYADGKASPGTDITFFDWPVPAERRGTNSITRTGFRVDGAKSMQWWESRLADSNVASSGIIQRDGRSVIDFDDPEGQRLSLVDDASGDVHPWHASPIPPQFQIRGLGPVSLSVSRPARTGDILVGLLNMEHARRYQGEGGAEVEVFTMAGDTGAGTEIHLTHVADAPHARQGAGGVHHVAFRTTAEDYAKWDEKLRDAGVPSSGPVDRFYFRSLYFREPNGILFEIATDEPGFTADEPLETLGERLSLPPFLEPQREKIEAGLKPF